MDQSYSNASNSEPLFNGGDWSPRISFSHSFACIQRVPSPTKKSPLHDSEFEFSRSVSTDLLSADELFCDGKLRPLKLSSLEGGKREWKASPRRQEVKGAHASCDGNVPSSKEEPISVCTEDPISSWEQNGDRCQKTESAGEAKSPTSRASPISVCRRTEKVEIRRKPVELLSPTSRKECISSVTRTAEKLEDGKATCTLKSRASSEGLICACKLEMHGKAGKSGSPTSRKEVMSVHKLELGESAGKSRSPTGKEELIPACTLEISSKAGKVEWRRHTSREDVMFACKKEENLELKGKAAEEIKVPTSKEDLLSACSASQKSEKGGTPVIWREELQWAAKRNEEDEHASPHMRKFSKNPRSASMIIEGSWKLGNRSCVSLNNSRCQSPSRSFSLPATTPASPSASSSYAGFASSSVSSSSKYRSKIKDFFKLRKPKDDTLPPAPESSSSSTCRLPLSPRSLFAFFKSKESSKAGSKSSISMNKEAHEYVCASNRDLYTGANIKSKVINSKELSISSLTLPNSAKPPPNPSFPFQFTPSSTSKVAVSTLSIEKTMQHSAECAAGLKLRAQKSRSLSHEKVVLGIEGPNMLVIDEGLWEEGNLNRSNNNALNRGNNALNSQRIKKLDRGNMMVEGSKGGGPLRPKGLERPLPYTSSVRVTPVLNVPSCITPSLRKTKPSSKPKAFIFDNLFARKEKALITPPPSEV